MPSDDVSSWIYGLAQGDEASAQQIWETYFGDLVRLARRHFDGFPRRAFDEEDIALSAMNSVVRGVKAGRFPRLNDRYDLWKLLVTVAAGKARDRKREETAQKRGGGHVRGESGFGKGPGIREIMGGQPTPDVAAELSESCEELLSLLDPGLRTVALLKVEGFTNAEIAQKIDRSVVTVERRLKRIREKWSKKSSG